MTRIAVGTFVVDARAADKCRPLAVVIGGRKRSAVLMFMDGATSELCSVGAGEPWDRIEPFSGAVPDAMRTIGAAGVAWWRRELRRPLPALSLFD